mgnify:CR=1 FL=1
MELKEEMYVRFKKGKDYWFNIAIQNKCFIANIISAFNIKSIIYFFYYFIPINIITNFNYFCYVIITLDKNIRIDFMILDYVRDIEPYIKNKKGWLVWYSRKI